MWPTTTATYQVIASLHKSWNIWMINNDNIWYLDLLGVFSLRLQFFPAPHSWHCQAITYASKELLHEEEAPLKPWGVRTQDNSLVICPCLKIIDLGPRTIQDSRMYFVDSVYKGFYSGGTKAHLFGKMNDSPVQVSNILELLAATHMWKTILDCENSANRRLFLMFVRHWLDWVMRCLFTVFYCCHFKSNTFQDLIPLGGGCCSQCIHHGTAIHPRGTLLTISDKASVRFEHSLALQQVLSGVLWKHMSHMKYKHSNAQRCLDWAYPCMFNIVQQFKSQM